MTVFDHRRGRSVDVAGARIYAESLGPTDAPVLVLLHGGFGNIEDFNGLLPALNGWRVIGIDGRGQGASTMGTAPWSYQRVQEDVEQVLHSLGIGRCTLLGFSDGGIVALRLGASSRVQVDRIVVIGSTWHHKNLASSKEILQKVTADSWRKKFPETYEAYQRLNPEPDFERLTTALVQGWLDESPSGHPDDRVADIQAPVLVVRGDDDPLTALNDAVELRGAVKKAHFLGIPFAGHVAHVEGEEVFLPALRRFLGQADGAAGQLSPKAGA
ncbi:alpha/beta hydrolase [Roseateles sp.]|uniref:alpha/beta fold hydrolase n=1 Tax=Roseateles sp. TaxID=1971397 RepID=UPI003266D9D9